MLLPSVKPSGSRCFLLGRNGQEAFRRRHRRANRFDCTPGTSLPHEKLPIYTELTLQLCGAYSCAISFVADALPLQDFFTCNQPHTRIIPRGASGPEPKGSAAPDTVLLRVPLVFEDVRTASDSCLLATPQHDSQ